MLARPSTFRCPRLVETSGSADGARGRTRTSRLPLDSSISGASRVVHEPCWESSGQGSRQQPATHWPLILVPTTAPRPPHDTPLSQIQAMRGGPDSSGRSSGADRTVPSAHTGCSRRTHRPAARAPRTDQVLGKKGSGQGRFRVRGVGAHGPAWEMRGGRRRKTPPESISCNPTRAKRWRRHPIMVHATPAPKRPSLASHHTLSAHSAARRTSSSWGGGPSLSEDRGDRSTSRRLHISQRTYIMQNTPVSLRGPALTSKPVRMRRARACQPNRAKRG